MHSSGKRLFCFVSYDDVENTHQILIVNGTLKLYFFFPSGFRPSKLVSKLVRLMKMLKRFQKTEKCAINHQIGSKNVQNFSSEAPTCNFIYDEPLDLCLIFFPVLISLQEQIHGVLTFLLEDARTSFSCVRAKI